MSPRQRVAIVGVGYSTIGRSTGLSLRELSVQASLAAADDAGLTPSSIDGVTIHSFPNQFVSPFQLSDDLGIPELGFFSASIQGPAYVAAALHGAAAVASGSCETCLTVRTVQRAGASGATRLQTAGGVEGNDQFLVPLGAYSGAHWAGMYKQRHMSMFGTTDEQFGAFAHVQREYATKNADALLREPLSVEDYLRSRYIVKPLRLFDCDYPVDAGSALIFTTEERARDLRQKPVFFDSWSLGMNEEFDFYLQEDMARTAPWVAAKRMWAKTSLQPSDVDVAGLYDGFSIITFQWLEALGFCGLGEAGPFVEEGNTRIGGAVPTNTDGGAANVGRRHGANYFIEVTRQLRGQSGDRQVEGASVGAVANAVGGFAGCALLTDA